MNSINCPALRILMFCTLLAPIACADSVTRSSAAEPPGLWARDNLVAWCAAPPWDAKARGPEERAQMLKRLGFKHFAYNWNEKSVPSFDAEIEALQKHGINLLAWALYGSDNSNTQRILQTFRRHGVRPQLWVIQPLRRRQRDDLPKSHAEWSNLPEPQKSAVLTEVLRDDLPKTPTEEAQRLIEETDRIAALVKTVAPYGVKVNLYNHNGWLGMVENQLAVIERLKEMGVTSVGMVYNFSHARDGLHDDSRNFRERWAKMKTHVVAVNITGLRWESQIVYPSQGDGELEMMRVIQDSGWRGPIGVIAEKGGDAEVTLKNYLIGLDWLAAELERAGSGGTRPFPPAP